MRAILFLASLVFLSRNGGEMTHSLERALALLAFVVFCLAHVQRPVRRQNSALWLIGIPVLVAGLAAIQPEPPMAVAALAVAMVGLWLVVKGVGIEDDDMPVYVLTALGFAVLLLVARMLPETWYAGRWLAQAACTISGHIPGSAVAFRPSYAGFAITGLLIFFWCSTWLFYGHRSRWQDLVVPIALTLAAQALYLILAGRLLDLWLPTVNSLAGRSAEQLHWYQVLLTRSVPWNFPFILFLLNIPIVIWGVGHWRSVSEPFMPSSAGWVRTVLAVPAFAACVGLLCYLPPKGLQGSTQPIVFYEKGFLNWESPQWGQYGPLSVGMFGNLPRFVESLGLTARRTDDITSASLADASALVIINLNQPLPTTSTTAIWDFVNRGGTLLVLGDHTWYDPSGRVFVNELLAPASIAFHFDSAISAVGGWLHGYDYRPHPLTVGLGDERNEAGIVTGASLAICPPAYPIILGRHGFEDRGNRFKPDSAYLGNMAFDADEPLGDTVLAAAQRYGRGKVLVFGDTSSFANGIVVGCHEFVGRVFRWIATRDAHPTQPWTAPAAAVLLAIAVALLLWRSSPGVWVFLALSLLTAAIPIAAQRYWANLYRHPLRGDIAYLDQSHLPMASEEGWRDDGLMGFLMNLMRSGLLAFNLHEFDDATIAKARLVAIVAPAKPYTRAEIAILRTYVERGGTLLVAVGWEESYASRPLLGAFDIEMENLPLGYFQTRSPVLGLDVMFYEAWPVRDIVDTAEIIAAHGEYPVVLVKPWEKGRLIVIGDSHFLMNKNLEAEKSQNEANIAFLKVLLEHVGFGSKP
jgi:hypothetical protein